MLGKDTGDHVGNVENIIQEDLKRERPLVLRTKLKITDLILPEDFGPIPHGTFDLVLLHSNDRLM